jgi:transposase
VPRGVSAPGARLVEFTDNVSMLAAHFWGRELMEVIHPRCSGLDVHKETVVACVRLVLDGKITREVRSFETTTSGLLLLLAWLTELGCTHVAMEATGVYWKPVWNILSDGDFELILANAAHIKNVPGRKTDVSDAAWIADLLAHGLIRSSFVPEQEMQELRELLRTRKQLGRQQSNHIKRLQKTLESANVRLDSVITDIVGKSGRAMLQALIAGETDPVKLVTLADRRIKASAQEWCEALRGRVTDHHRFLLHLHLQHIDFADAAIQDIDRNVTALITRMDQQVEAGQTRATFQSLILLLMTIPGIDVLSARIILSEIGRDMSRFPTAGHLLSWAGCAHATMRVPASAVPPACVRATRGSRPCWSNAPGPPGARKAATSMHNSSAFAGAEVRRRQPVRSRPRSLRRSTTCSRTAHNSRISVPIISIAARRKSGPNASSPNSQSSASMPLSRPSPGPHEGQPMSRTKITLLMPALRPRATLGASGAFRAHPVSW